MSSKSTGTFESPLGLIQVESEEEYVISIKFVESGTGTPGKESVIVRSCIEELKKYFSGERESFSVPLKFHGSDFEQQVWNELLNIPYGQTITYEHLAIQLGDMKKIRAAGRANGKNPIAIAVPCHRVIGKDGSLVGYAGGLDRKEFLLNLEGAIGKQISIF
jgi:methylated-DNA-[protein]-cysteine S-methyltransferase